MTKQQVRRFIRHFDIDSKIIIKYLPEHVITPNYPAVVSNLDDGYLLELSIKNFLHCKNKVYLKAILVHELGHIVAFNSNIKITSFSFDEYIANKWALQITKKKGFLKIHRELKSIIDSWKTYTWNQEGGVFRRYIKAASM